MNPTTQKRLFAAITVILALTITLVLLEVGIRIVHHYRGTFSPAGPGVAVKARTSSIWIKSDDPILIYTNRPNYEKDGVRHTESNGILRAVDVQQRKPSDTLRIALVGDSIAAGIYLDYAQRFGTFLERLLGERSASKHERVEVLNFAVNGYRTIQEARLVETKVKDYDPDLIILQYCMNDAGNSLTPTKWFLARDPPTSHLVYLFKRKLGIGVDPKSSDAVPVFGPGYGSSDYWFDLYQPDSNSWKSVEEGFRRIDVYLRQQQIPILLVIFPFLLDESNGSSQIGAFHEQIRLAARRFDWPVLDLLQVYSHVPISELRAISDDIYHPSAKGFAIAAQRVSDRLEELGLLKAR